MIASHWLPGLCEQWGGRGAGSVWFTEVAGMMPSILAGLPLVPGVELLGAVCYGKQLEQSTADAVCGVHSSSQSEPFEHQGLPEP